MVYHVDGRTYTLTRRIWYVKKSYGSHIHLPFLCHCQSVSKCLLYFSLCVRVCLRRECAHGSCQIPWRSRWFWTTQCRCWELNLGPLRVVPGLAVEPSPDPPHSLFRDFTSSFNLLLEMFPLLQKQSQRAVGTRAGLYNKNMISEVQTLWSAKESFQAMFK